MSASREDPCDPGNSRDDIIGHEDLKVSACPCYNLAPLLIRKGGRVCVASGTRFSHHHLMLRSRLTREMGPVWQSFRGCFMERHLASSRRKRWPCNGIKRSPDSRLDKHLLQTCIPLCDITATVHRLLWSYASHFAISRSFGSFLQYIRGPHDHPRPLRAL